MDYILFILLGKDDPRACQVILNLNKANIISLQRGMQGTGAGWAGHWVDIPQEAGLLELSPRTILLTAAHLGQYERSDGRVYNEIFFQTPLMIVFRLQLLHSGDEGGEKIQQR